MITDVPIVVPLALIEADRNIERRKAGKGIANIPKPFAPKNYLCQISFCKIKGTTTPMIKAETQIIQSRLVNFVNVVMV
jgi:hypothetical protein